MRPRQIALARAVILVAVVVGLFLLFPRALAFTELATRELRYLWWLILLVLLGCWLLWASRKRP